MTTGRVTIPSSSSRVGVSWAEGVIQLRDVDLCKKPLGDLFAIFVRRVFALAVVKRVEIDFDRSTVDIGYDSGRLGLPEVLERLATALRAGPAAPACLTIRESFGG